MNGPGEATNTNTTNRLNIVSSSVNTVSSSFTLTDPGRARVQRNESKSLFGQGKDDNNNYKVFTPVNTATPSNDDYTIDLLMPDLEDTANLQDTGIFGNAYDDEDVGAEADINNFETTMSVIPITTTRIHKDHPKDQILGEMEPKKVTQALDDESWVEAMQEELLQFKLLNVWTLVDLPHGKRAIGTKWVFGNKKDQRGIVVRIKGRLVIFCLCIIYGLHCVPNGCEDYFLYGTIEEEVYVRQPPGFVDLDFPNRVFRRGTIDKTLFIKKIKNDILLVQVYVDDIIFRSTKKSLSTEFEQLMHKRFQMSSMGELTFFLGLQVEQRKDGIFLSQDKYVCDILKKFGFSSMKTASTPMETHKPLLKDADGTDVDVHLYRSMIGSLMYLTSSRLDIMFAVCACLRFQVQPKASHMHVVRRIFRYLKGQPTLGLWYPKDSPLDLIAYSDSDYTGASIHMKSTIGDFLAGSHIMYALTTNLTIYVSLIEQFWQTATVKTINDGEQQITVTVDGHTFVGEGPAHTVESQHTPIASPTTSQHTTSQPMTSQELLSHEPLTEPITTPSSPPFTTPTILQTTSSMPHDSPLIGGDTPGSDEGSKKLKELTDLKKAKLVILDEEEDLLSEDPSKQGRMPETKDEGFDHECFDFDLDQTDIFAAKILADASKEKTFKSYTRRRSTDSSRIAQKLNEEEKAKAVARKEQERIDFEKALELQKQLDEREETDNIDWNTMIGQIQER
ncbi:putative ribonuclease H-like domain-containing protein [Tanacetum coccineum]